MTGEAPRRPGAGFEAGPEEMAVRWAALAGTTPWAQVATWLIDVDDEPMLASQGLAPLRAGLRHVAGRDLTPSDREALHQAATAFVTQLALLERIHALDVGPVVVLKGPEMASRYPHPSWRRSGDLDLFAADAPEVQRRLLAGGFEPAEEELAFRNLHHLVPLQLPGFRVAVEVHHGLGWPAGAREPPPAAVVATAVPAWSDDRFLALPAELALAHQLQHAWHAVPFGTVRDAVDLVALRDRCDPGRLERDLRSSGLWRLWTATERVAEHALGVTGASRPLVPRVVARPLLGRRDETMRLVVPRRFLGLGLTTGPRFAARSLAGDVRRVRADRSAVRAARVG